MDLARFARRRYTPHATAIEPLPNLSRALGGPNLWIKRDDTLDLSACGQIIHDMITGSLLTSEGRASWDRMASAPASN